MTPLKLRDWLFSAALGIGVWVGIAAGLGLLIHATPVSMRFGAVSVYPDGYGYPDPSGRNALALALLAGAGLLYAVLLLAPLAEPGPRGVGVAFALLSAWALVHAGSFDRVLGGAQIPGWGYGMLLAVPLLVRNRPLWTAPPVVLIAGILACVTIGAAEVSEAVGLLSPGDSLMLPGEYGKEPLDPWWARLGWAGASTAFLACAGLLFLALLRAGERRVARPVAGGLLVLVSVWAFADPSGYDWAMRGLVVRDTVWGYAILLGVPLLVSAWVPAARPVAAWGCLLYTSDAADE